MFYITLRSSVFVLPPEMCLVALFRPVYYVCCVTYVGLLREKHRKGSEL
jgi:hypothetical protein